MANLFSSGLSGYQVCLCNSYLLDSFISKVSEVVSEQVLSISQAELIFSASVNLS